MKIRRFCLWAFLVGLALLAATGAEAQLPKDTRFVASSSGQTAGKSIVAFNSSGTLTTVAPIAGATAPSSICMGPYNDEILFWDSRGLFHYTLLTGTTSLTTLVGSGPVMGALDGDSGLFWATSSGEVFKSDNFSCTALYTLALMPTYSFNAICMHGSTGEYVVAGNKKGNSTSDLFIMDVNGFISSSLSGLPLITGLDWSPWTGDLVATCNSPLAGMIRIDLQGKVTTVNIPVNSATSTLTGIEVREQPSEAFLCTEAGSAPQHLTLITPGGQVTTLHTSSGKFSPTDAEFLEGRPLWATSAWNVGLKGTLSLNFGAAQAGKTYQIALSWGHMPGIPVTGVGPNSVSGHIHVAPDGLFFASMLNGPPVFNNFSGTLNSWGQPKQTPYVNIPDLWILVGLHLNGAAVAYDKNGITAISNCWSNILRWT